MFCLGFTLTTLYAYTLPSMESLKREKKLYRKLGNHGKIMQRKFCMACMEPYMALGYGCQERLTREIKLYFKTLGN